MNLDRTLTRVGWLFVLLGALYFAGSVVLR